MNVQAFDMEQGALAKWCTKDADRAPPTAVLVHGILGSKRNLKSFTKMLLQVCPWCLLPQALLFSAAEFMAVLRPIHL
jgi:hypothetical protein